MTAKTIGSPLEAQAFASEQRRSARMQWIELGTLATIHANRSGRSVVDVYADLLASIDDAARFLGSRVLLVSAEYPAPDLSAADYDATFTQGFLQARIDSLGFECAKSAYLDKLWIEARGAALWCQSVALDVPPGIRWSLDAPDIPPGKNKTGPKTGKREAITDKMVIDVRSGDIDRADLESMREKTLEARYSAARSTCREARRAALRQLDS